MEPFTTFIHRYVMHLFGWVWHKSHHTRFAKPFELNDLYPVVFSFLTIYLFVLGMENSIYTAVGIGITLYGIVYFIVHEIIIHSQLVGNYNAENILAAACVGKYFDVGYSEIQSAIENYIPENNRSELKEIKGNYFILDAYNANPSSMKAALENFHHLKAEKKIVLIGDMLELGEFSESEHKEILQIALGYKFDTIVTIGPEFLKHKTSGIIQFMNSYEAKEWFNEQQFNGATILLKGSRGMQLEKVINNK